VSGVKEIDLPDTFLWLKGMARQGTTLSLFRQNKQCISTWIDVTCNSIENDCKLPLAKFLKWNLDFGTDCQSLLNITAFASIQNYHKIDGAAGQIEP
jgi:hypothetical protein